MSSVKRNFIYNALLTTANYIFPLLTYPYITRVLGVESIGLCGFIDSIINYFIIFSALGINILGIREIASSRNDNENFNKTFTALIFLNTITTIIMFVVLIIVTFLVPKLYENWEMMLIGALKLLANLFLIEWLYRGLEDFKYITLRTLSVRVLYVIMIFIYIKNENDTIKYYFLTTIVIVFNAFININHARKYIKLIFSIVAVKNYIKPYASLGVYSVLTSMYTSFNVAYLGFISDNTQVGYYTTATKLFTILISLFTAFTGVMMPRMCNLIASKNIDDFIILINKSMSFLLAFIIPIALFSIIFSDEIVHIIAGKGYEGAVFPMQIIMPLLLIYGFSQIFVEQILMPLKKDKAILLNSIIGAFVGVLLNIIFTRHLQSVGSAIVLAISETIIVFMAGYEVKRYIGYTLPWKFMLKKTFTYLPLVIILYSIKRLELENSCVTLIISFIILSTYVYIINIKLFNSIVINILKWD